MARMQTEAGYMVGMISEAKAVLTSDIQRAQLDAGLRKAR